MRTMRGLLACVLVLAGSGCAQKGDWIEGTLVTVDVSGVWRGRTDPTTSAGGLSMEAELTAEQRGPKVTGVLVLRGERIDIEGTVRGDVFSFAGPSRRMKAELTVRGDEMSGQGVNMQPARTMTLNLKRQP